MTEPLSRPAVAAQDYAGTSVASRVLRRQGHDADDAVLTARTLVAIADGIDGVGGSGAQVLAHVHRVLGRRRDPRSLVGALRAVNASLWLEHGDGAPVAATVTVATWSDRRLFVGQVGDSRAYLVRHGSCQLLTVDQLDEARWQDEARWSGLDGLDSPARLGHHRSAPPVQVRACLVYPGDRLVLCTDGLWRSLGDTWLAGVSGLTAPAACDYLCDALTPAEEDAAVVVVAFGGSMVATNTGHC